MIEIEVDVMMMNRSGSAQLWLGLFGLVGVVISFWGFFFFWFGNNWPLSSSPLFFCD
jgi:hypothetical protein